MSPLISPFLLTTCSFTLHKGECLRTVYPPIFDAGMGVVLPGNGAPLVGNTVIAAAPVPTGTALFQFTAKSDPVNPGPGKVRDA